MRMVVTSSLGRGVGWEAGGYLGSSAQWCAEHPSATATQRERVACLLLACADRAEHGTSERRR